MRSMVLALAVLSAGSDGGLEYDSRVRKGFAELEEQVALAAKETGMEDPDRLVPVLMTRRSLWVSDSGDEFFERLNNGFWVQKLANGDAKLLTTVSKQGTWVELGLVEGGWRVRLYEDRFETKSPTGRDFKKIAPGRWVR